MFQEFVYVTFKQKEMAIQNVEMVEYVQNRCSLLRDLPRSIVCLGLVSNEGEEDDISSYQMLSIRTGDR